MSLLSDKICHHLRNSVTFGQKVDAHPFQWNEKLSRPEFCRSKRGRFIWLVNIGILTFYTFFIFIQCLHVNVAEDSSKIQKIYMRFMILNRILVIFGQLANVVKRNQFPEFASQFSTLMKQFEDSFGLFLGQLWKSREEDGEKGNGKKILIPKAYDFFLDIFWFNGFVTEFGMILLAIIRPQSPEFLSSVLIPFAEDRKILKLVLRIFLVVYQIYFEFIHAANCFLWIVSGFAYIFPGIVVLQQIKALASTGNGNSDKKKNPSKLPRVKVQRIMKMYRQMEILQKSLHDNFCTIIFPALKAVTMTLTICSSYGGLKMGGILAGFCGFLAVFVFSVLVMLMETLAEFHRNSQEILSRMKSPHFQKELNLYDKKMLKSFNLIQIKMGSSYVVDKKCVATVIKIVADSTMNFVLANP